MMGIPWCGGPIPARRLSMSASGRSFFCAGLRSAFPVRGTYGVDHSWPAGMKMSPAGLASVGVNAGSKCSASEMAEASTQKAGAPGDTRVRLPLRENLALADRSEAVAHAGHHHLVFVTGGRAQVADRVVGAALVVELRIAGVQRAALGQRVQVVGRPAAGVLARGAVGFVALGVADRHRVRRVQADLGAEVPA